MALLMTLTNPLSLLAHDDDLSFGTPSLSFSATVGLYECEYRNLVIIELHYREVALGTCLYQVYFCIYAY